MDAIYAVPEVRNEPVRNYPPGSPDRDRLAQRLADRKSVV